MIIVVVATDGGFLDGSIHSLDLYIGPRMIDLGEAMLDPMFPAAHIEHVGNVPGSRTLGVARREPELDAVVGQNCVDLVGHGCNERDQERRCGDPGCCLYQLAESELAGAVYGHEKIEFSLAGSDLGYIDVEVTDRIALELLL